MSVYTFSWYVRKHCAMIEHPKWWQPFRKARLVHTLQWKRIALAGLSEDEGKILMRGGNFLEHPTDAAQRLVRRMMGADIDMVQLEYGEQPSGYVATTAVFGQREG